jgi:uncharacterized membrane protein YhaH (DUF805 family)
MELMFAPLRKFADFNGRARRSEYWLFTLFAFIVSVVLSVIGNIVMGPPDPSNPLAGGGFILQMIWLLILLVPSLAVGVRRLHDTDRSGWWLLISFVPLVGGIVLLVFNVLDGTPGPNKFGPDPKGRGAADTFS